MPRNYSSTRKTNGQASILFKSKSNSKAPSNNWQKKIIRKPVIATVSSAQRKKKDSTAPVSPTEASIAPVYYDGGKGNWLHFHPI